MRQATTPTHTFELPFETERIAKVRITYKQGDHKLIKEIKDCALEGDTVQVTLTQEETLAFDHDGLVEIQMQVVTKDGEAMTSDVSTVPVEICISGEVLT